MERKYGKPLVTTFRVPERKSYACNLSAGDVTCGTYSNIQNKGICAPLNFQTFNLPPCN